MQAQFAGLSKEMANAQRASAHPDNVKVYQDQLTAVNRLRNGYSSMVDGQKVVVPGLNQMMQATGSFTVSTLKSVSATTAFNKSLADQKIGLGSALRNLSSFKQQLHAATQEQVALQKASAAQFTTSSIGGKNQIELYVPKDIGPELDSLRTKYGMMNYSIGQLAKSTLNWGKNTQWAGRQLTAGITMPVAMAAAGVAVLAVQADQQLTRITKVYNTESSSITDATQRQASTEVELANLRKASLTEAVSLAKQYGASVKDTLSTEADLAAIGKTGNELMQSTAQVTRVATLGELDHQTALDMTISLMSAFKLKASDLGDAFNYMNALENQTSLSTQDFATAIPKAASALASLGVNVQQFGVLMTAFKEGGVDATQGANALKSATARLLAPTAAASDAFAKMNININQVVTQTKGNLFDTLSILAEKMRGFDATTRLTAIKDLFGTYQFNRLNVVLNGLGDALSGVSTNMSQTAEAVKVMNQGAGAWADTANQEMQQLSDSASFKLKKAFESLKAEFITMGQPIMNALSPVLNFVTSVVHAFNNAPSGIKKFVAGFLIAMSILGPLTMIVGLFANWTGNIFKLGSSIAGLFLKFKPLNEEQAAQQALSRLATQTYDAQAQSVAILAQKMQALTAAMAEQAAVARTTAAGQTVSTAATVGKQAATAGESTVVQEIAATAVEGAAVSGAEVENMNKFTEDVYKMGEASDKVKENTAGAKVNFRAMAAVGSSLVIAGLGIKQLTSGTASWMDELLNVSLILGALEAGGVMKGIKATFKALADETMTMATVGLKIKTAWIAALDALQIGFKGLKTAVMWLFTNPFGIALAAIIAIGAAIAIAVHEANKLSAQQDAINKSAKDWADILGFTEKAVSLNDAASSSGVSKYKARAEAVGKLRDANSGLADALASAAREQDGYNKLYNMAVTEALKVKADGGSVAQAKQAFDVALQASGIGEQTIDKLDIRFKSVQLNNPSEIVNGLMNQIQLALDNAPTIGTSQESGWSRFWDGLMHPDGLTDSGRATIKSISNLMTTALQQAATPQDQKEIGDKFASNFNTILNGAYQQLLKAHGAKSAFDALGVKNANDLYSAFETALKANSAGHASKAQVALLDAIDPAGAQAGGLTTITTAYKTMATEIGKSYGLSGASLDTFVSKAMSMKGVLAALNVPTMTVADAQADYNKKVNDGIAVGKQLTDAEKLKLLNQDRVAAGLPEVTDLQIQFNDAVDGGSNAAGNASTAYKDMADALTVNMDALSGQQYTDYMKNAYSGAMDAAFSQATALAQRHEQSVEQGIQDAGQKRQDALKAQEKTTSDYYDAQAKALDKSQSDEQKALDAHYKALSNGYDADIKAAQDAADAKTTAIQNEINALQNEDTVRQQLFDREKTRIERMAQLFSNNVDYNAALNGGNLDEAAKIYSSNQSTIQGWSSDDQQQAMDAASKARQDGLQKQIDSINAARDAYVNGVQAQKDALGDLQQAESDALQQRQQNAKDELDAKKQAAQDALTAAEDAESKKTQNAVANQQLRAQQNQANLDLELATLKASVPRTKEEYDTLISQIETAYGKYGIQLQGYGDEWSGYIGASLQSNIASAAASLQSDIGWAQIGTFVQQQIDAGAGISMAQVTNYLKTGVWSDAPAGPGTPAWVPKNSFVPTAEHGNGNKIFAAHIGGYLDNGMPSGISPRQRTGVPANAPLHPSEMWVLAQRGEFMVKKSAAEKNLGLLQAINGDSPIPSSGFQVRHLGGPVGLLSGNDVMMNSGLAHAAVEKKAASNAIAAAQLAAQRAAVDAMVGYTGGMTASLDATLNFGRQQQGKPYIWGGTGPAGQDCSGFISVLYNFLSGHSPAGNTFPWGRDWTTSSFSGGREFGPWKRGGGSSNRFRIGVDPGSHMAGTLGGINVESGSGHGPMVGGKALGANSGFAYQYYLPAADLPQLFKGGSIRYDNTLANLHKGETVLTEPLTQQLQDNIASGFGNTYNVDVDLSGAMIKDEFDFIKAVRKAMDAVDSKNGRKKVIG